MRLLTGPEEPRPKRVLSVSLYRPCPDCDGFRYVGEFVGNTKLEKPGGYSEVHSCSMNRKPKPKRPPEDIYVNLNSPEHVDRRCRFNPLFPERPFERPIGVAGNSAKAGETVDIYVEVDAFDYAALEEVVLMQSSLNQCVADAMRYAFFKGD